MRRAAAILILLALEPAAALAQKFYPDDPLIQEPAPRPVKAVRRKLSDYYDILWHTLATPGERHGPRKLIRAQGINTLGDPLEGAWWERRHYWRPMSLEELAAGAGKDSAPSMDGPWTVIAAKTEGITPGFVMLDSRGRRYFVKFDPLSNPEMATGAELISSKIFYALGYHVPENYLVYFPADILTIGEDVTVADRYGRERRMTRRDLSAILYRVPKTPEGLYRATASLAVPGKPLGPYRYFGTRADDPNDTVPHEHRRDLRAMHLACALVNHDDSRSINNYDALTDGPTGPYVKHYQLDFGSTLGSGSDKVNSPRSGGEYLFGWKQAAVQFVTLGLAVPRWARAHFPELPAVGRFESAMFDPDHWVPEYPNPAFRNRLPDDEFWMARQIVALRDEQIRAIIATARYSDPRASEWIAKCLIERRDKIGRAAFAKVLPIDRFELEDGRLVWTDLAALYGLGRPLEIRIRWDLFDNQSERSEPIPEERSQRLPAMPGDGYWMALIDSPERPDQNVRVYLRKRAGQTRIVGVERNW
jgi:hypothetical protein